MKNIKYDDVIDDSWSPIEVQQLLNIEMDDDGSDDDETL